MNLERNDMPPVLRKGIPVVYDIDDVDGKMYMLDHRFSGCALLGFTKRMDEETEGTVTYEGERVPYVLTTLQAVEGAQFLGVFVRNICTEYGKDYVFHFEGFQDTDGNRMEPEDFVITTAAHGEADPAYAEDDAVAQKAAEEGIVLLKNEGGVLPLGENETIRLVGGSEFRAGAVGAGKINPRYMVRLGQAVEESGFTVDENAQTAVLVISRASGENYDNGAFPGQYYLTDSEIRQIRALRKECGRVIAIINSGYPMDVRFIEEYGIDAALWCGYPGMLGGRAVVNVLNGTVNPSGKLPDTWSLDYYDIPSSRNFYQPETPEQALNGDSDAWINTVYEEDIYVGYRYFETFQKPVAYKFGHGLSYTDFEIHASFEQNKEKKGVFATVEAEVTNTGKVPGKEVVQIYASIPEDHLEQPSRRLVAFKKTGELQPGETQRMVIPVREDVLTSFDEESSSYVIEKGTCIFYAGDSLDSLQQIGTVEIPECITYRTTGRYMNPPLEFTRLSKRDPLSFPQGKHSGITGEKELCPKAERVTLQEGSSGKTSVTDEWSVEEMARFSVCANSGWGVQDVGVAGRIAGLPGRNIPYYAVADGNNGVNIHKKNIGMPTSNLVCASWNEELAYEIGKMTAREAKENNVQMILAPAMNIHRNPLCGRHSEYFSEDPLLTGIMAGYQAKGLEENGVSACLKHVCCNNAESARKRNQSILSVRALREIYLRAFETAFRVHSADSVMTGYNACNGVFAAEDEELIQGILREEFGFCGFVMTDWTSYDTVDIAKAVQAGNCWITPGTEDDTYVRPIIEGVRDGRIRKERLRQNVGYLYSVIMKHAPLPEEAEKDK